MRRKHRLGKRKGLEFLSVATKSIWRSFREILCSARPSPRSPLKWHSWQTIPIGNFSCQLGSRAVEKALVAEVPEEIRCVVFGEEVLWKIPCKISHLIMPQTHCLVLRIIVDHCSNLSVEQSQKTVVLLENLKKNSRVFLPKSTVLELWVSYCFSVLAVFISVVNTVETFGVLDYVTRWQSSKKILVQNW